MRRTLIVVHLLLAAALLCPYVLAQATWDMDSMCQVIKPLANGRGDRMPMLIWQYPIAFGDAVALRQAGTLRTYVDNLAARGIGIVGNNLTLADDDAVALALTIKDAGEQVHLNFHGIPGGQSGLFNGPTYTWNGMTHPSMLVYDTNTSYNGIRTKLQMMLDNNITVAGAWFDYEGYPHPWNGVYYVQANVQAVRDQYVNAGIESVLASKAAYTDWVYPHRSTVLSAAIADAVSSKYANALNGNYGHIKSVTGNLHIAYNGTTYPAYGPGAFKTVMPILYANTNILPNYFSTEDTITQELADEAFFFRLMRTGSIALENVNGTGVKCVPFLSYNVASNQQNHYKDWMMSSPWYRELMRHLWFRGMHAPFLFHLGVPAYDPTPQESFSGTEDARVTMDEALYFQQQLNGGTAINFAYPAYQSTGVVWSGMKTANIAVLRLISLSGSIQNVNIEAFDSETFTVAAPAEGGWVVCQSGYSYPIVTEPAVTLKTASDRHYVDGEYPSGHGNFSPLSVYNAGGYTHKFLGVPTAYQNNTTPEDGDTGQAPYVFATEAQLDINVWVKQYGSSKFFYKLDDGAWATHNAGSGGWHWRKVATLSDVPAGTHVFKILRADASMAVDKILFVGDANYTPGSADSYEVEDGQYGGGAVLRTNANASGGKALGSLHIDGSYFQIDNVVGGEALVTLHFANGGASDSSLEVVLNGETIDDLVCTPTGGWDTYTGTASIRLKLKPGANSIRFNGGDGGVNPDYIEVMN